MSKDGIRVIGFETRYRPNGDAVDWVHYTSRDALNETGQVSHSTWARVSELRPRDDLRDDPQGLKVAAVRHKWSQIAPAYEAWKQGQEIPEVGVPLAAWSGVTVQQADALRRVGLRTVEDVASCPEGIMRSPPIPNLRQLKTLANQWLEGRGKAEAEQEIVDLRDRLAEMERMLVEMTSRPDEPDQAEPEVAPARRKA